MDGHAGPQTLPPSHTFTPVCANPTIHTPRTPRRCAVLSKPPAIQPAASCCNGEFRADGLRSPTLGTRMGRSMLDEYGAVPTLSRAQQYCASSDLRRKDRAVAAPISLKVHENEADLDCSASPAMHWKHLFGVQRP